ncbi:hypothetical protein [Rhodocytophaga aerolata]
MKPENQKNKITNDDNDGSEVNWKVVGPILAIIIACVIWAVFF